MLRITLICLVFLGAACQRPDNPQDNGLVLTGVFEATESVHSVRVQRIAGTAEGVTNAKVNLWFEGQSLPMEHQAATPGTYSISADLAPLSPGAYAAVRVEVDGAVLSAETTLPQEIEILGINSHEFVADPGSSGVPTLFVEWNDEEEMLYVLSLDTLGTDPHPEIPFTSGGGNFDLFFNLPVTGATQSLWDTDFGYYGLHQLTVYAIPEAYEQLYLYPSENFTENLLASPDNIENGSGYLTSVSKTVVSILVLEE